MPTIELRVHHAGVVRTTVALVGRIQPPDLSLPTPCAKWDLGQLLTHMTVQHRGFAAAARGHGDDPAVWRPAPSPDPVAAYAEAAEEVIEAFAGPYRDCRLPEITPRPVPGRLALGFHLVDYVVHGWDVARTLGLGYEVPPEVLAVALPIAAAVPDGDSRLTPGAAFAPAVPTPGDDPLEQLLARLGRDPATSGDLTAAEEAARHDLAASPTGDGSGVRALRG